jgi:glycosyltransferase involved in cell wall biosynthesis
MGTRVYIGLPDAPGAPGGGSGANRACVEALRSSFSIAGSRDDADLQVCSFSWDAPAAPRRLFIDHGSFADAAFWAYSAPRLRTGDTILVASRVCERVAERFIEGPGPRIVRVPFPVDTRRFRPADDRRALREWVRQRHDIPADGPLLLVAAAFVRRKNQHLAVRLFEALRARIPSAHLLFAGATPDRPTNRSYADAVRRHAAAGGHAHAVHFAGSVDQADLARLMAASDLLVHLTTCRIENFGLVVAEAMAAGLPVVASDWGGLRDLVQPGVTGLLAPTWLSLRGPRVDWMSVLEPAAALLRDAGAWTAMAAASRSRAALLVDPAVYGERLRAAVRAAAAEPSAPDGPPAFTPPARELIFRTISLNATHPEIEDAGDEFRLLMPLDGGVHYRLLAGPAASAETPPRVTPEDQLYAAVTWRATATGIEILDPAWPGMLELEPLDLDLLERCDGKASLASLAGAMPGSAPDVDEVLRRAQQLVDAGVLCPVRAAIPV